MPNITFSSPCPHCAQPITVTWTPTDCPACGRTLTCAACTGGRGGQAATPRKGAAARANLVTARARRRPPTAAEQGDPR